MKYFNVTRWRTVKDPDYTSECYDRGDIIKEMYCKDEEERTIINNIVLHCENHIRHCVTHKINVCVPSYGHMFFNKLFSMRKSLGINHEWRKLPLEEQRKLYKQRAMDVYAEYKNNYGNFDRKYYIYLCYKEVYTYYLNKYSRNVANAFVYFIQSLKYVEPIDYDIWL